MPLNLAIDGPVGAGKSTIADEVARRLGILHLDTGAMYRAVGLTALERGVDPADEAAVTALSRETSIGVTYENGSQRTFANGADVTERLRTEAVSMAASTVAKYAAVRAEMVRAQRRLAANAPMLLDGRDIGTRVLPEATVKIYLTASPEERARRRFVEQQRRGGRETYEQVLADLIRRDAQDMNRAVDPLRPADDAVTVDTTSLSFEETVAAILTIVKEKTA